MKPFDLEAAKRGEPLVMRDGRAVTEFRHFETSGGLLNCIAIASGFAHWISSDSGRNSTKDDSPCDLFMAPKKRTVHVQIFGESTGIDHSPAFRAVAFHNQADAERNVLATSWQVLGTFPVEIEE